MHVVVQRRAEAVQEGDGAEPRAGGCGGGGVNRHGCRSAQQPLDLSKRAADCRLPRAVETRHRCGLGRHDQHRLQCHLVAEIRRRSGVLERMIREGHLGIAGMVYDVGSGTTQIVPNTLAGLPPGIAATLPAQPSPGASRGDDTRHPAPVGNRIRSVSGPAAALHGDGQRGRDGRRAPPPPAAGPPGRSRGGAPRASPSRCCLPAACRPG